MVDTVRTLSTLLTTIFQDGQATGSITANDVRDALVSMPNIVPALVSAAGTTAGTATVLTSHVNIVTACAIGAGVKATASYTKIYNKTMNTVKVYPITSASFNGLAVNAPQYLKPFQEADFVMQSTTVGYSTASSGEFTVSQGRIWHPDGTHFIPKGVNCADWALPLVPNFTSNQGSNHGAHILTLFPGISIVRLNCQKWSGNTGAGFPLDTGAGSFNDNSSGLTTFVNNMTAVGCVSLFGDHTSIGGQNNIPTGQTLTDQLQWYANMATAFKDNPYVWFYLMNEPAGATINSTTIATHQRQQYDAIRGTGARNPIMLQMGGGFTNACWYASQASLANMFNVIWDVHYYSWISGQDSSGISIVLTNAYFDAIVGMGSYRVSSPVTGFTGVALTESSDGPIPVFIGEYGTSSSGTIHDAARAATVTTVQRSGLGCAAWTWWAGTFGYVQNIGVKSSFGVQVAADIAGTALDNWSTSDNG